MHITRVGLAIATIVWLLFLILFVDLAGNSRNQGIISDLYFGKIFLDVALIAWTGVIIYGSKNVASAASVKINIPNKPDTDEIVDLQQLSSVEHVYYGILTVYAIINLLLHWITNRNTVGGSAVFSALWAIFDLIIAGLSGWQFYNLQQGN